MILRTLLALCLAAFMLPGAVQAKDTSPLIHVGDTTHFTLEKDESTDYRISLVKGDYYIVLDAKRTDDTSSNIIGKVQLLKTNGVVVEDSLLSINETGIDTRVGDKFHIAKPLPARLRISHENNVAVEYWMTVLPVSQMKFVPFGWGAPLSPAKISSDEGVGGELNKFDSAFYSITLPPGKWSISLGLELDNQDSNLAAQIDMLTPYGFTDKNGFVFINTTGRKTRQEGILNVYKKPKTIIFRVKNIMDKDYKYDLTIEKATD